MSAQPAPSAQPGQVRQQQNYCNLLPPTSDYDPTYASIEDYPHSFLHTNSSWMSPSSPGLEDDYTNHLRTSSYALLAAGPEPSRAGLRTSVFQSLPYMAASQVRLMMTIFT